MPTGNEDAEFKRIRHAALQTLYTECMRNWTFMLDYRFRFLQSYLLIISGAGAMFAWLWPRMPSLATIAWLIAAMTSSVLAFVEYRTGTVLHSTRIAGKKLEDRLRGLFDNSVNESSASQKAEQAQSEKQKTGPKRKRREKIREMRAEVEAAASRTPGYFSALAPTFDYSVRQGKVLFAVYLVGAIVFILGAMLNQWLAGIYSTG